MESQSTAAEAGTSASGRSWALEAGLDRHGDGRITQLGVPEHIIETLQTEGVHTLDDWARLGDRRYRIFGITTVMAAKIDMLIQAVRA